MDARRLRDRLRVLARQPEPDAESILRLEAQIAHASAKAARRRSLVPRIEYPADLPVSQRREEIAGALREHQVIVVCGETGSGKTTQLPKLCLELGRGVRGQIGHTQPRRIAARAVAARVAEELGASTRIVGYKVRFGDHTSPDTLVKLMTDGILLAETQGDRELDAYDTIIIDEAHERSLNIDFLLGYVKTLLPRRPDLKVIITSATIDPRRFSKHFNDAPIIMVSGRAYPVEVIHRAPGEENLDERDESMQRHIVAAVDEAASYGDGDILIFLSGEREIRETAETLHKHHVPGNTGTEVLPLYAKLSSEEQMRVFRPHEGRRIVLATNVAETSLTVPGIRFVIDTGVARISRYSARTKVQRLEVEPVSRASADQRKGRCGRVGSGVCFRLYSEEDYLSRPQYTDPEIVRTNLAAVILQMTALKLGAVEEFPFLDSPDSRLVQDGYDTLHELGAVTEAKVLTPLGRDLARLPIDPRIGRMLLAARDEPKGTLADVLVIAGALSVPDPRERPMDKQQQADEAHAQWRDDRSDFLSLLRLWDWYQANKRHLTNSKLRKACKDSFASFVRLREWEEIHHQLADLVGTMLAPAEHAPPRARGEGRRPVPPDAAIARGVRSPRPASRHADDRLTHREPLLPLGDSKPMSVAEALAAPKSNTKAEQPRIDALHRALLTGLLSNIGAKGEQGGEYNGARSIKFNIFPGSALFRSGPPWLMAAELVRTTRLYARTVAGIDPAWIERLAGHLVKRSHFDPHWEPRGGKVMAFEKVSLYGLELVARRRVHYGPIDPVKSREVFILHGLVRGGMLTEAPFFAHNMELVEELSRMQIRSRKETLLADEHRRYEFYAARIPQGICTAGQCEHWYQGAARRDQRLLFMTAADVAEDSAEVPTKDAFPDALVAHDVKMPLEYMHKVGDAADGVTVRVPIEALSQLPAERLAWIVPGLLEEKIDIILKGLAKEYRRLLPGSGTLAHAAKANMRFGVGSLFEQLREAVRKETTFDVPREAFERVPVPEYLRMRIAVIDADGSVAASGRDLVAIRTALAARLRGLAGGEVRAGAEKFNRDGLKAWDFGELPERIEVDRFGTTFVAYPGIVDKGDSVSLRLFEQPDNALAATRAGLRRLFILDAGEEVKRHTFRHPEIERLCVQAASLGSPQVFRQSVVERIVDGALASTDSIPRNPGEFRARSRGAVSRLGAATKEVCALADPALRAYQVVESRLRQRAPATWEAAINDIREQLSLLMPPNFLMSTPREWLPHVPRYLAAIDLRFQRLAGTGFTKDLPRMNEILPIWRGVAELNRRQKELGLDPARIVEYRWMVEELRVSLFAQELRTAYPVSVKRMHDLWEAIVRG